MNPLFRWAGSKRQLLPKLVEHFPANAERYIEPFAGSACLFFRMIPKKAILSDINGELVGTYLQIKSAAADVFKEIVKLDLGSKEQYYQLRSASLSEMNPASRAARFIYLNRYSFNGLYRTNLKGEFNVPFGGGRSGSLPSEEELLEYQRSLKGVRFVCADFGQTLGKAREGDFVYMDPPYMTSTERVFREYDARAFGTKDLKRIRRWMEKLTERNVRFVVSYSAGPESSILSKGFDVEFVDVRRNIAGFAANRRSSREVLITNRTILKTRRKPTTHAGRINS